jgi:hypothetical protein
MRTAVALLTILLLAGCGEDDPASPERSSPPVASRTFEVTPVRSPGGSSLVTVTLPLDEDVTISRTEVTVASTGEALLPSPWAALYRINGEIGFEGRSEQDVGIWELQIRFRNESSIVCSSCDAVIARYRLWK